MSNLLQRTLSSIVFVMLILGPLFISPKVAYLIYTVLGLFTLNEIIILNQKSDGTPQKLISFAFYVVLVFGVYEWAFELSHHLLIIVQIGALIVFTSFIAEVFRTNEQPFQSLASSIIMPVYIAGSFCGVVYFLAYRDDLPSIWLTISVFALIWINDVAAYLVGSKLGRTKLFERLSPKKTIEGSFGGLCFALIASYFISMIPQMPSPFVMAGFGLTCVVAGSLGDLLESRLKRTAGVKDSGKFLPGHGGFFDRFDAMMLAIPASIIYFELILPKP